MKEKRKKKPKRKRHLRINYKSIVIENCQVSDPDAYLNKKQGDQAKWISDGGEFALIFQGKTPFKHSVFVVRDLATTPSGPVKPRAEGTYKYRVVGDSGCDVDPNVHIGP